MKKKLAIFLALLIVLSSLAPAFADQAANNYEEAGRILEKAGVLQGSEDGDLMLKNKFKRQDMVILMSRLYGEESKAKVFPVKNTFKDVKDKFYQPYISWAVDKKLITGMSPTEFGFGQFVTVQQYQTVLLRTLGYEKEASDWDKVPQHANQLGIMKDLTIADKAHLERGLMAQMTVNALELKLKDKDQTLAESLKIDLPSNFKVESKHSVDRDVLTIKGNVKDVKEMAVVVLAKDQAQKPLEKTVKVNPSGDFTVVFDNLLSGDYSYHFKLGQKLTEDLKFKVDELPFELVDILAENLREIHLNFTNPVDPRSALFVNNYTSDAGDIGSVRLANKNRTIVLTLASNKTMVNKKTYAVDAQNIVSKSGKSLSLDRKTFTAFDNAPPEVLEVKALGNQRIKISLSEPVKYPSVSNFKVDDRRFTGRVQNNDNIITLIYPSSQTIAEGRHTVTIAGLEDFADYRAITVDKDFTVEKDSNSPKIKDYSASMEEVLVEFDKEIDENSINRSNFYWISGRSKRHPESVTVLDNKIKMNFSGSNSLPASEVTVYMDKVKDYYGNSLKEDQIKVKATVDTTSPQILSAAPSKDGRSISLVYSKNVRANDREFYKLTDSNKRMIPIRSIEGSGRNYKLNLGSVLAEGVYNLEVSGAKDTSPLQNIMTPYSKEFSMKDLEEPRILSHSGYDNQIVLIFNKDMDIQTITDPSNYLLTVAGRQTYLPSTSNFELIGDNRTVRILLPREINGSRTDVGSKSSVTRIQALGLKSSNGLLLSPSSLDFTDSNQGKALLESVELIEPGLLEAKFNQPIVEASTNDFYLRNHRIKDVEVDGSRLVKIILDEENTSITSSLEVIPNNRILTLLETGAQPISKIVEDKVGPRLANPPYFKDRTNLIYLPFTEKLSNKLGVAYVKDIYIEEIGKGEVDFTTSVSDNEVVISITNFNKNSEYLIRLVDRPNIISDVKNNLAISDGQDYYIN